MPRGRPRGGVGRRGRPTALSTISTMDLHSELERRQSMLQELIRRRDELDAEVQALGGMATAGGGGGAGRRGPGRPRSSAKFVRRSLGRPAGSGAGSRPRNAGSLVESLRRVLNGKTLSVTNVAEAVKQAGYKTTSSNFRVIVNQALLANPKVFRKVARGEYTSR